MAMFVFRCPNKKQNVQGFAADDASQDSNTYLPVRCTACRRLHHVNPATARVLGVDDDKE